MTFVNPPLFRRPHQRKGISRIQVVIANQEVKGAVEILGAGLGDDFNAASPRARELRRVWVPVDSDFLDGGWGDSPPRGFKAIDDERCPSGSERRGIQKARQSADYILIQDWQISQLFSIQFHYIEIVGWSCVDAP